jgi:aryl-alcohol dehydrogenase-like predicted oxidoreductase
VHWPDQNVPIEETLMLMDSWKKAGYIGAIGVCNFDAALLKRAIAVTRIDVLQADFCALNSSWKQSTREICQEHQIRFMSFGSLAKGILAGSVFQGRQFEPSDYRSKAPWVLEQYHQTKEVLSTLVGIAASKSVRLEQLAVAWVLSHLEVATALCGFKNQSQLSVLCGVNDVVLSPDEKALMDRLADQVTPAFVSCWASS